MTARAVLLYPDRRLAQRASEVTDFGSALRMLVDDLKETMGTAAAVGLTAPHIGVALRVVVLHLAPSEPVLVYVNPVVETASTETMRHVEGSVSMPGVREEVERPRVVTVRYQDVEGREHLETVEAFHAICFQHEIDQLDGVFWIERLSRLKRERAVKRYMKIRAVR